jgi:hypothetical protein
MKPIRPSRPQQGFARVLASVVIVFVSFGDGCAFAQAPDPHADRNRMLAQGADQNDKNAQRQARKERADELRAQREAQRVQQLGLARERAEAARAQREENRAKHEERMRALHGDRYQGNRVTREQVQERIQEQQGVRAEAPQLCRRLVAWYSNQDDVPEQARRRKVVPLLGFPADATAEQLPFDVWMLADSRFVPLTGKPYDAMAPADFERYKTALSLGRCIAPHRQPNQAPAFEELLPKDDAFILNRLFTGATGLFAPGVKRIREMRARAEATVADVAALTADETGLQRYREIAKNARRLAGFVPDLQRKQFESAIGPSNPRVQEMLRVQTHADADKLSRHGNDLAALEQGTQWGARWNSRYEGLHEQPLVRELMQTYRAWRTERLLALRPQLEAMIKEEGVADSVDRLVARFLPDARGLDPQITALVDFAASRRQSLAREREVAINFSERERSLMTPDMARVVVPARYGPPTAQEMTLAFVREMEALGQRRYGADSFDFAPPFPLLREMAARATIRDIQIDTCSPDSAQAGYRCKYRLKLTIRPGDGAQRLLGGSVQMQMLQSTFDMVNQSPPAPHEDHFVLRESGWRSDTIRGKGVKAIANTMQTLADNVSQAAKTMACLKPTTADRLSGRCP